ncbi:EAL domain-containing protein [soil metagenome]
MQSTLAISGVTYDGALFAVAVAIALAAGLSLFRLRSRMRGSIGMVRTSWLFLAGLQAGAGIWAAHTLIMLAVHPVAALTHDPFLTLGSLLICAVGGLTALSVAWTGRDLLRTIAAGLIIGLTVGISHFTGLSAMHVQGVVAFEPIVTWGAVVLSTLFATVAFGAGDKAQTYLRQLVGGALFAAAVLGMQVMALGGANITSDPSLAAPPSLMSQGLMVILIVMISVIIVLCGLGAAYIDDTSAANSLRRTRRLADAAREGIVVIGEDGAVLDCNAAFAMLLGEPVDAIMGRPFLPNLLTLEPGVTLEDAGRLTGEVIAGDLRIPVEIYARPLGERHHDGRVSTVVALRDLRERQAAERRIQHLSDHDALTGLPNRGALLRMLESGLARVQESKETLMVINIEVSNYRETGELYGMAASDALLCKIGERLQRIGTKPAFAARQHGADFTFVAYGPEGGTYESALEFVRWLGAKLRRPLDFGGTQLEPQLLFGVSASPHDAFTSDDLLNHASVALEQARRQGETNPDGCCLFSLDIHEALREQRALARDLKVGIGAGQLVVYYQPQARLDDGSLCGFEALVRWRHPERGMMPPDTFISVAEESGRIGQLGEWVLRRACADAAAWPRPMKVAVNLSPLQVSQDDLPELVHSILFETGLSPSRLELEITESALFQNYQRGLDILRRLKALGVRIAMDDFGTGFSSLSTLHSFPFDKIKIDKSFVEGIGTLERSTVIVRAVLGIGRGLSIPVVAEGVETAAQLQFLRDENCAEVQGYHIGRPAPAETYADMMLTGQTAASPIDAEAVIATLSSKVA